MIEYVYCAVDKNDNIQWVEGSSKKTRYFRTTRYLNNAVKYHNEYYNEDPWRIQKFQLVKVKDIMNERILKKIINDLLDWLEDEHLGLYQVAYDKILEKYNIDVNDW
jgi:hypothetical protein